MLSARLLAFLASDPVLSNPSTRKESAHVSH